MIVVLLADRTYVDILSSDFEILCPNFQLEKCTKLTDFIT